MHDFPSDGIYDSNTPVDDDLSPVSPIGSESESDSDSSEDTHLIFEEVPLADDSQDPTSSFTPRQSLEPNTFTPHQTHLVTRLHRDQSSTFFRHSLSSSHSRLSLKELEDENRYLRQLVGQMTTDKEELTIQRNAAEMNAIITRRQNAVLQHRLDSKEARKETSQRIHTTSRVVSWAERQAEAAKIEAERLEKNREKLAIQERRAAEAAKIEAERLEKNREKLATQEKRAAEAAKIEAERLEKNRKNLAIQEKGAAAEAAQVLQHVDQGHSGVYFTGSLGSKKKDDLQEVAAALAVSQDGTKAELIRRIAEHLNTYQDQLSVTDRFAGLYASLARGQKRSATSENGPAAASSSTGMSGNSDIGPPMQRRHLTIENPHPVASTSANRMMGGILTGRS